MYTTEDKDTTRFRAIIAIIIHFIRPGYGMWQPADLTLGIKIRRWIRGVSGGLLKVLHLLKIGYQTSQGEILAVKSEKYGDMICHHLPIQYKKELQNHHKNKSA